MKPENSATPEPGTLNSEDSTSAPETRRVLLTGFDPFGGRPFNTSWETVRALQGLEPLPGFLVAVACLPVVWATAYERLHDAIEHHQPALVINVGEARDTLRLERHARNCAAARPDNHGALPAAPIIEIGGPQTCTTLLDTAALLYQLQQASIAAVESLDAGDYLCNYVSYRLYHAAAQQPHAPPALFVHVPALDHTTAASTQQARELVAALRIIVQAAARQVAPGIGSVPLLCYNRRL